MNLIGDEDYGKVIVLDTGMTEKRKARLPKYLP